MEQWSLRLLRFDVISCPVRQGIIGGGRCCVLKEQVFPAAAYQIISPIGCVGFNTIKGKSCSVFWFLAPQESASATAAAAIDTAAAVTVCRASSMFHLVLQRTPHTSHRAHRAKSVLPPVSLYCLGVWHRAWPTLPDCLASNCICTEIPVRYDEHFQQQIIFYA